MYACYKNLLLSERIAIVLLQRLRELNAEYVDSVLQLITFFLRVEDEFQYQRMEWILGVPHMSHRSDSSAIANFGLYAAKNLDDQIVDYISILSYDVIDRLPLLQYIIQANKDSLLSIHKGFHCLKCLLLMMDTSDSVLRFVLEQPAYCATYANFIDFFKPLITKFLETDTLYSIHSESRDKLGAELYELLTSKIEPKLQKIWNEEVVPLQTHIYTDTLKQPYNEAKDVLRGKF